MGVCRLPRPLAQLGIQLLYRLLSQQSSPVDFEGGSLGHHVPLDFLDAEQKLLLESIQVRLSHGDFQNLGPACRLVGGCFSLFTSLLYFLHFFDGRGQYLVAGCIACGDGTGKVFRRQFCHKAEPEVSSNRSTT